MSQVFEEPKKTGPLTLFEKICFCREYL